MIGLISVWKENINPGTKYENDEGAWERNLLPHSLPPLLQLAIICARLVGSLVCENWW